MRLGEARGLDMCFSSGLLTATGAETVYDTTVAIVYSIDGRLYSKAAVTDGATPTTDVNTGAAFVALQPDKACAFLWMLNAAGTVAVAQGPIVDVDGDTDLIELQARLLPAVPSGYVPFAYQVIQTTGASSAWTFGSGDWNAAGVTDAIVNISTLPHRPPTDTTS